MKGIRRSGKIDHIFNYRSRYEHLLANKNTTEKFQFEDAKVNEWLGGGVGMEGTFEFCLLYGSSGAGKSILAENLCVAAGKQGKKYALLSLENDPAMTWGRMLKMYGGDAESLAKTYMEFMCRHDLKENFTIEDVGDEIDRLFNAEMCELVVIDHIQELMDLASRTVDRTLNENEKTRKFMQVVQDRLAANNGTLVLLAHTNKSKLGGMESVYGSSSLYQKATKVIEINRDENGCLSIKCHKSRNSPLKHWDPLPIRFDDNLIVRTDNGLV